MSRTRALRLLVGAILSVLLALLFSPFKQEPDSRLYSMLSTMRADVPLARDILLIESGSRPGNGQLGSELLADILITIREFEARSVLILIPTDSASDEAIRSWKTRMNQSLDEEFSIITNNTKAFFEAIRLGSIRPKDGTLFLDAIIDLVAKSKDRLSGIIDTAGAREISAFDSAQSLYAAHDLGYSLLDMGLGIPLRDDGLLVAEYPKHTQDGLSFRRLELNDVLAYSRFDASLIQGIETLESAGYLSGTNPDAYPPFLYAASLKARKVMLASPGKATIEGWREARKSYLASVKALLDGKTESTLLSGYESILASESLDEAGANRLRELMAYVRQSFSSVRANHAALKESRRRLEREVPNSLCVIGTASNQESQQTEDLALVINSTMMGRRIFIATDWKPRALVLVGAMIVSLVCSGLGMAMTLGIGAMGAAMMLAALSLLFVARGIWIDPVSVSVTLLIAAIVSAMTLVSTALRIVRRDGEQTGKALLPLATRHTRLMTQTVVLALRQVDEAGLDELGDGSRLALDLDAFNSAARHEVLGAEGEILDTEGFLVIALFHSSRHQSSPPRSALQAAFAFITTGAMMGKDWRCGLSLGDCYSYRTATGRAGATGRPLVHARLLSTLASQYDASVLATQTLLAEAGEEWERLRLDSLVDKASGREEVFYRVMAEPEQPISGGEPA